MPILDIRREFNLNPNIVGIVTSDNYATITTAGYFETQADEVAVINNGAFEFLDTDIVLIHYEIGGIGWFTYNATTDAFVLRSLTNLLPSGQIIVGNGSNVATAVAMSGAVAIDNTGATSLTANSVNSSNMNANLLRYVAVPITASQFNNMVGTPIPLVTAGGANTLVILDKMFIAMTYNSSPYAAGGPVSVQWANTGSGLGVIASTTIAAAAFQVTASTGWTFNGGVVPATYTTCVNQGLYLSNITTSFSTGNSPMIAHVWYKTIPSPSV